MSSVKRFYEWEDNFPTGSLERRTSIVTLRRLARRVARDHRRVPPVVVAGAGWWDGSMWRSYNEGDRIVLKPSHRTRWTLLHELAHWLQGERGHPHGRAFVRRFMGLLERYGRADRVKLEFYLLMAGVKV